MGWSGWEEFPNLTPMIKLTYKSQSRIKTTEKQALPSAQPETETLVETVPSAGQVTLAAGASAPSSDGGKGSSRIANECEVHYEGSALGACRAFSLTCEPYSGHVISRILVFLPSQAEV
jgi:hypothetical protein